MKKEIVFAVGIGLVVGLIITFGVYRARQAVTGSTVVNTETSASPTPLTNAKEDFTVTEPQDESLVVNANLRVSGKAFPNAGILILSAKGEVVGQADANGNFSLPVPLDPGANILTIRASGEDRDTLEVIRTVVLSSADLTASSSATPRPMATPAATKKPSLKVGK